MKKKLVNRKVVSSIGVGILAAMTTCTSVYAATDVIPQEGENKQEDSSEAEVPIREQTEEEKQLTDAKDSLNEITTNGVEEEVKETEESEEGEAITVDEENINQEIKSALNEAGGKVDEVQTVVSDLNDQNAAVETNNNVIEEIATSTEAGSLNQMTENIVETEKTVQDAVTATDESKKTAEEIAENVEEAQQTVYESSEAAQEAKDQAQVEVQEAEEALSAAQDANDEAEKRVDLLEAELTAVEQEKAKADAALAEAREAEAAAKEALKNIQEQIQSGESGYEYNGNAEEAIRKAEEALTKAQADVADAESAADAALAEVERKQKELDTANGELTAAAEDLADANSALEAAQEALQTAEDDLIAASGILADAQNNHSTAVNDEAAKKSKWDAAKKNDEICQENMGNAQAALDNYTKDGVFDDLISEIETSKEAMIKDCFDSKAEEPFKDGYYVQGQELTKKLIEYQLLKNSEIESADQVSFSDFHDVEGQAEKNQNYVMASYQKGDETCVKYYDYLPDPITGEIMVIEKEVEFYGKNGDNTYQLIIEKKNGETVYTVKRYDEIYKVTEIEFVNGYYEVKKVVGLAGIAEKPLFKGVFMPQFATIAGEKGTPIFEGSGDTDSVVKDYVNGREPLGTDLDKMTDAANKAAEDLKKAQEEYDKSRENLASAKEDLDKANEAVLQKTTNRDNAQNTFNSARDDVQNKENLKKAKDEAVTNLKKVLEGLKNSSNSAVAGVKNAKAIQIAVNKAYDKVEEAIQSLVNLSANTVNEAQYEALLATYNNAVTKYEAALKAKGVYGENLEAVKKAVDRARAAAEAEFRYNSSSEEDDNTQGGTTGGEETGGTTEGGTTGGGTTDEGGTGETGAGDTTTGGGTTEDGGTTGGGAGDEGGAATDTGAGTDVGTGAGAADTTLVTTIADAEVPLAPTALTADGNAAMANAGATLTANRGAAGNRISRAAGEDELAGEGEEDLVVVEDEEVPLAAVDLETEEAQDEGDLTEVADEEVPLAGLDLEQEKNKMSWWWLLIVAICGVTGYEMYRRHKKNQEQEEVK